jgi:hypothetical protein
MLDLSVNAIGRVIGAVAFACGLATWIVLANWSCLSSLSPPGCDSQLQGRYDGAQFTVTAASAILSCAGLMLSMLALFSGQNTVFAWSALGTSAAFWVIFGVTIHLHRHPL